MRNVLEAYLANLLADENPREDSPQNSKEEENRLKIHFYYLPVLTWILEVLKSHSSPAPFFLGISGPQGVGKSTLTRILVKCLGHIGIRAVTISIDDFYLTHQDQLKLASTYPSNPLLQQRGYPGTHDIELGLNTLHSLQEIQKLGEVKIPVYDKSKNGGQGDRLPQSKWKTESSPLNLVFLEGWMLGFSPVSQEDLPSGLQWTQVNDFLTQYGAWHQLLNGFLHLIPQNSSDFIAWRIEAEERMKAEGKAGMSGDEIRLYLEKFVLAYKIYLPRLLEVPPVRENRVRMMIAKNRLPVF